MKLDDLLALHIWSRQGRIITAKKRQPIVYNPDAAIKAHVDATAGKLHDYFASENTAGKPMRAMLGELVKNARMLGFEDGAHYSGKKLTDAYVQKVDKHAKKYSRELASQISQTTRKGLKNETPYVTTSDRATAIAAHEGRKAYNKGLLEAMGGNGFGKSWMTGDSPCPDCQDNEDDDIIDMNDVFSSGDDTPPAHPNCGCTLGVHV